MNKRGILEEVSGNVVKIDGVYYDASNVITFLPRNTGIEVEFNVDDSNKITYIKPVLTSKNTSKSFTPKNLSRPSKTQRGRNRATSDAKSRSEKIAKQLLLKIADNKTNIFSYSSIDEALDALDKTYQKLKEKYLDELK